MKIKRKFAPGSEWLYLKIYTGIVSADTILVQAITPLINYLVKENIISKWFFLRYYDPDFHLRIRLLLTNTNQTGYTIQQINIYLLKYYNHDIIWKIQYDTYIREIERYGNKAIELSESIFSTDSSIVLKLIKIINKSNNENYRWMISLRLIDFYLDSFCIDINNKCKLLETLSMSFKKEFGFNKTNSKQFNIKYREKKILIEQILSNSYEDSIFKSFDNIINSNSKLLNNYSSELKKRLKSTNKSQITENLLSSYIHMMINRLFKTKSRLHELVIYDFMSRYYRSILAQKKINSLPD